MVKSKLLFTIAIALLLVLPFVAGGQPTTTIVTQDKGLTISYPFNPTIKVNEPFYMRWWVYNSSNGALFTNYSGNVTCTINLMSDNGRNVFRYNDTSSGFPNGSSIGFGIKGTDKCQNCFFLDVNKTLINKIGVISFQIRCMGRTAQIGGFYNGNIIVTSEGYVPDLQEAIFYCLELLILFSLFILCLFGAINIDSKNEYDVGGEILKINYGKYIKLGLAFLSYLFLWIFFFLSEHFAIELIGLHALETICHFIFITMSILFIPIAPIIFVLAIIKWLADIKLHEEESWGFGGSK